MKVMKSNESKEEEGLKEKENKKKYSRYYNINPFSFSLPLFLFISMCLF